MTGVTAMRGSKPLDALIIVIMNGVAHHPTHRWLLWLTEVAQLVEVMQDLKKAYEGTLWGVWAAYTIRVAWLFQRADFCCMRLGCVCMCVWGMELVRGGCFLHNYPTPVMLGATPTAHRQAQVQQGRHRRSYLGRRYARIIQLVFFGGLYKGSAVLCCVDIDTLTSPSLS